MAAFSPRPLGGFAEADSKTDRAKKVRVGLREADILGTQFKPLRFVIPFINTPTNIAKIGFEYSPAGFAKLAQVGLKTPEASEVIAKATIGTLAMAGFAGLAASGRLTGAAPSDPAKRDSFYRSGKQPFSVKIGNRWVQYNQMVGPLSMTLAATAGFSDAFTDEGEIPTSKRIATAGSVIGQSVVDATFFRGIENLVNALTDPEKAGEKFVSDMAGGFVPFSGLNRNISNALDHGRFLWTQRRRCPSENQDDPRIRLPHTKEGREVLRITAGAIGQLEPITRCAVRKTQEKRGKLTMITNPQPRLLKTKQAAAYLCCSPWKLRELVRDEKIPRVTLGEGVWHFDVQDLDKFIESSRELGA